MTRETNLETYLEEYGGTYVEIYRDIKDAVQGIWQESRLAWYTDHGVKHSGRIIFHLNCLCSGLLRTPPDTGEPHYGLEPVEVFLLLASAWLHDVGMQDLSELNELSVDEMNNDVWDEVRKRHPNRASEIIMEHASGSNETNEFWLGIKKEPKIHAPLALICKGHGSEYFADVIGRFRERTFNVDGKGTKIRGELLTALLLMADELDLHSSRAVFKENFPLSKVSRLHHYRHHYIEDVEVIPGNDGVPETHRRIKITFCFPPGGDSDNEWQHNLIKWVSDKIEKEAKRTAYFLHDGFNGHFSWADPLIICRTEKAEKNERRIMEQNLQYLLAAEIQKVVDWKDITYELKTRIREKKGGVVCLIGDQEKGVDRFISFIESIFYASIEHSCPDTPLAILNFSRIGKYHSIEDVFDKIAEQLGGNVNRKGNESIIDHLQAEEKSFLIILQDLDRANPKLIESIHDEIVNKCQKNPGYSLFLITMEKKIPLFSGLTTYDLPGKYEEKDIYEYFIEMGDTEESAHYKAGVCLEYLRREGTQSPGKCMQIIEFAHILSQLRHGPTR